MKINLQLIGKSLVQSQQQRKQNKRQRMFFCCPYFFDFGVRIKVSLVS